MNPNRLLARILRGDVGNVPVVDLIRLIEALGFREVGGRGSHRVVARTDVVEFINLQAEKGEAKRYQVRRVATLVRRYNLTLRQD
jgi:hypothetical protein